MWPVAEIKPSSVLGSSTQHILKKLTVAQLIQETRRLITTNQTNPHAHSFEIRFSVVVLLSTSRTSLTNFEEQSPFREADSRLVSKETFHLLRKLKFHYRFHRSPPVNTIWGRRMLFTHFDRISLATTLILSSHIRLGIPSCLTNTRHFSLFHLYYITSPSPLWFYNHSNMLFNVWYYVLAFVTAQIKINYISVQPYWGAFQWAESSESHVWTLPSLDLILSLFSSIPIVNYFTQFWAGLYSSNLSIGLWNDNLRDYPYQNDKRACVSPTCVL